MTQPQNETDKWIYRSGNPDAGMRLFCFPYAGGGAAVYRLWTEAMPDDVEVCRIQLPGRETRLREAPFDRLSQLVPVLLDVMRPLLDRPFAIFGHSMGALTGFEVARGIRREFNVTPERLFASGWRAPQLPLGTALHGLPEADFVERLQARFSGIPSGVLEDRELLELMLPILRADLAICETYTYSDEAPLQCPISAFGGTEDHWINPSELAAWEGHTSQSLDFEMFPGDHFFLNDGRQLVSMRVADVLASASAKLRARA